MKKSRSARQRKRKTLTDSSVELPDGQFKPTKIPKVWQNVLRDVPDYDSIKTAPEGAYFDATAANKILDFFAEVLTHTKGSLRGKPFKLERWQKAIVGNLFGWKLQSGFRRYREAFIYVPRKNGKSLLAAGIALALLYCDKEPGAEVYCAASDKDQAKLVFDMMKSNVIRDPRLLHRSKPQKTIIEVPETESFVRVASGRPEGAHGFNAHGGVIDELHAHESSELVDVIETSTGSRDQPMIISITTADFDRPSACNEKYDFAKGVIEEHFEDANFFSCVYEATLDDDWTKPETWAKANPNLGVSVSLDYMQRQCNKAINNPSFENTFKRLHLNIKTEQDVRFIAMHDWDACSEKFKLEDLYGLECYAGLDLSSTQDMTAFVMWFPSVNAVVPTFWVPNETIKRRSQERKRVRYDTWLKAGLIHVTDGDVVDYDFVRQRIVELGEQFFIKEIAIDRWNSTQLQTQLAGDGFEIVPYGQGYADMAAPTKELERLVIAKEIKHNGNKPLRWNISNVATMEDPAGNLKPAKNKSTDRIDGAVAFIMALGRAMVNENAGESMYETQGIESIDT